MRVLGPDRDPEVFERAGSWRSERIRESSVRPHRPDGRLQCGDDVAGTAHLHARAGHVGLPPSPGITWCAGNVPDQRNRAPGRFVAVQTAVMSRDPGRAADLRAVVEAGQPGRGGGRPAAGRAAGRARGVPWVVGAAEDRIAGLDVLVAGGHVCLAHDDRAGPAQPGDRLGVLGGYIVGKVAATAGRAHAGRLIAVLDGDRQPMQRAEFVAAGSCRIGPLGDASGGVGVNGDDRVERRVVRVDSGKIQLD